MNIAVQPVFVFDLPDLNTKPMRIRINEDKKYTLPIEEKPGFKIEAIHDVLAPYASFKSPEYTIKPTKKEHLGMQVIKGKIGNV